MANQAVDETNAGFLPRTVERESTAESEERCESINASVRSYVGELCNATFNTMGHDHGSECACGADPDSGSVVDLIVLIDSSRSMGSAADAIGRVAAAAIEAAVEECDVRDLRTAWFTVDNSDSGAGSVPGAFSPTFTDTHQTYLQGLGVAGPFQQDDTIGYERGEEGADAITDLAHFYDWREGSCRAIFYVSDTNLEGVAQPLSVQQAAVARAITACQSSGVAVFAHFAEPHQALGAPLADVTQTYRDLTTATGGALEVGGVASDEVYRRLLQLAICEACGATCKSIDWPIVEPCITISWGDSDCDGMESDDHERLCITICNCYDNVTFTDVSVAYLWVTDENGQAPPTLPDGSPSSRVYPLGPICFGDIGPCAEDGPTCVSQEAVIINRGVAPGKYQLHVGGLCYGTKRHHFIESDTFTFEICAS